MTEPVPHGVVDLALRAEVEKIVGWCAKRVLGSPPKPLDEIIAFGSDQVLALIERLRALEGGGVEGGRVAQSQPIVPSNGHPEAGGSAAASPIDMILFCPACGLQHIDEPDGVIVLAGRSLADAVRVEGAWTNPPHRSHLCHGCGHIWRPADVATNGVAGLATHGKADSPPVRDRMPMPAFEEGYRRGKIMAGVYALRPITPAGLPEWDNHHNAQACPHCNPHGWVLVPRAPTAAMIAAGNWLHAEDGETCWRAMAGAAPAVALAEGQAPRQVEREGSRESLNPLPPSTQGGGETDRILRRPSSEGSLADPTGCGPAGKGEP